MTPDERTELIDKPFPRLRNVIYFGHTWAGTLVPRDDSYEELMRTLKKQLHQRGEHGVFEYHGLYSGAGAITRADAIELFGEQAVEDV